MARKGSSTAEAERPVRTFTKQLQVTLKPDERNAYAIELAGEQGRLEHAQDAKEEATKAHNGIIKTHEARVGELATYVNQGWEYREVEVEEREDWNGKRIFHIRMDTAEEIFSRPMNEEERQRSLPLQE